MRKATKQDKGIVVDILHSAFKDISIDNSINFVVKQDKKKSKRLKVLMEYLFTTSLYTGEVFLNDKENACILLQDTRKRKVTINSIIWDLKLAFLCIGIENVIKVLKRERLLKKYHLKIPHIHPIIMGVKNEFKGMGVGTNLIIQLIKNHKPKDLPIVIETTTERNVNFYKKFGFEELKTTQELNYNLTFLILNK